MENQAKETNPQSAEDYNKKGNSYYALKKYEEAREMYTKAIELNPQGAAYHNNKGLSLKNLGKKEEALKMYMKAIELDSKKGDYYNNYALLLEDLGKHDEAVKMFDKAIEINPTNGNYYCNKGISLKKLDKDEEAIKMYDKAIQINPKEGSYSYNKAICLQKLGKHDEAVKMFDKAIEINSKNGNYYCYKGLSLKYLDKDEEAIKMYDNAIQINPKEGSYYYNKGCSLTKLDKHEEAVKMYDKAIQINPREGSYYYNKGCSLSKLEKHEEAVKMYDKAIEINPQNSNYYNNKGNSLKNLGKNEEAIKEYDKAIQINPKIGSYYYSKAFTLRILCKNEESIKMLNKAIEIDPNQSTYYNSLGVSLNCLGKYEEAINMYNKAIKLNPNYILSYSNKSISLNKLGKNQEARECIQVCSKLIKDGHANKLEKRLLLFIQNTIAMFEKIEKENAKIIEKVDAIVGNKAEKQSLQSTAQKFTNLLTKFTEQKVADKIAQNLDEQQNENKLKENGSNDFDEIVSQQKLINDKLADQNQTLLQKQQYVEEMVKKMEDKLKKQDKQIQDLNKNVEQINNDLIDGGVKQKAELNRELKKLRETEEDSVFNYYKTFYWTSVNVFQTYRVISTNLVSGNYKSDATDFLEKNGDKVKNGMKICLEAGKDICKGVISSVPIVGNIFNFIDKTISAVVSAAQAYSDKKDQIKFQNKVNAINKVISERFQTEENLSIKLALLAIRLTKFRKNAINFPPKKELKKGSVMSLLNDQISKVEKSHFNKTELHDPNDEGVKLALQDVILLISFISLYSEKIIKMQKSDIVDVLADVVEKQLDEFLTMKLEDSSAQPETQQLKKSAPTTERQNNECSCNIF